MVWSNDARSMLTFPPGATSGARIEIDANGIRVYDAGDNLVTFIPPGVPLGAAGVESKQFSGLDAGSGTLQFGPGGTLLEAASGVVKYIDIQFGPGQNIDFSVQSPQLTWDRFKFAEQNDNGGVYYEENLFTGFVIPNGVETVLVPNGAASFPELENGYGPNNTPVSLWSGGTWTAREDGKYTIACGLNIGGAGSRAFQRTFINGTVAGGIDVTCPASQHGFGSTVQKRLAAGDTVNLHAFQATGAAQMLDASAYVSIRRHLP